MTEETAKTQKPAGEKGGKPKGPKEPAKQAPPRVEERIPPRLRETYRKDIAPALMKRFNYKSVMQVPRLEKISINIGVGQATQDPKLIETAAQDLQAIVGQKGVVTKAKKSISNFKLRERMPIGWRGPLRR